ncbi:hypothetical protein BDR07DRAFT_1283656 [Suillus spraguei]|nr:hypothetical protein BDR07DRAFT_1283656 [Suillus spraguei]
MAILLIGCFSGTVFGGIHCLGWNDLFQWHAEQMIWRVGSLAIASASLSLFLLSSYTIWRSENRITACALVASAFIYAVARVTLLVLMLASFRSLPSGVYDTVAWTKFIPHL